MTMTLFLHLELTMLAYGSSVTSAGLVRACKGLFFQKETSKVLYKKAFLNISQNSQEHICARASFLIKKRLWHRCFPVNFAKFSRIYFLENTSRRLLLFFLQCAL